MNTPEQHIYTKGQKVKVFDTNGRHLGMPPGGWDGTIVIIGPKHVHIDYPGARGKPQPFKKSSRHAVDPNSSRYFEFPEEAAANARRAAAIDVLRRHQLSGMGTERLPVEVLEALAAVLTEHETPAEPPVPPIAYEPNLED